MQLKAELIGKFEDAGDCAKLLYVPPEGANTFRRTRRYEIDIEGSEDAVRAFVNEVLGDDVSHEIHFGDEPAFEGAAFHLDYGMKPTALDHEKETILAYYSELEDPGFQVTSLKITTRLYIFDKEQSGVSSVPFVRDIVNPAIHIWEVSS
jgi:hypothetical protein